MYVEVTSRKHLFCIFAGGGGSFFTQFIHRPSKLESYVCSISLIHFFPSCIVEWSAPHFVWLFSPFGVSERTKGKRNERRKTISSKKVEIYSYAIFARSLQRSQLQLSLFELRKCTTLIDMFECVFQVGLMMCNSTFSTTAKCAFPIFILNYFFARSLVFSGNGKAKFHRAVCAVLQHMQPINCGKDDALIALLG
jgi:hypothetical protein